MVCLVRNKGKLYKKTLLDIWGYNKAYLKASKIIKFRYSIYKHEQRRREYYKKKFTFSLDKKLYFRERERFKKKYLLPRLLFNYYLLMKKKMFLRYAYKAKRRTGHFLENYLTLIEGRLFMLIYRSNFVSNIFKLKYIIQRGIFLVNTIKRSHPNFNVRVGDLIQVDFKYKKILKHDIKIRLKYHLVLRGRTYKYMFINYKFMFIFFLRPPRANEIKYPLKIDIYLGSDLYFL